MAKTTYAAYIYNAVSGLASRCVVSDEYASPAALTAAHCGTTEAAVVVPYTGSLEQNKVDMAIAKLDDEAMQAVITGVSKITPPPKITYALVGPSGRVFDTVVTRRIDDPRLARHQAFETAKAVPAKTWTDAKVIVDEYPKLENVDPTLRTKAMMDAHALVAVAIDYGHLPDTKTVFDPGTASATKVADTAAGFTVFKNDDARIGDAISALGVLRKRHVEPVVVKPGLPEDLVL